MAGNNNSPHARGRAALLHQLSRLQETDRQLTASGGLSTGARLLAGWQVRRLEASYADLAADPRYARAMKFFMEDLYGPEDFAQRDADLDRVFPVMSRMLPTPALDALTKALELHVLTQELDADILRILEDELGMRDVLDPAMWAEAYRRCDRRADRRRQIELIGNAGRLLDEVVRRPLVYGLVVLARGPAHAAGFGDLQSFVERGFVAFRGMPDAQVLIATIEQRETHIMEGLLQGEFPASWQETPGSVSLATLRAGSE